MNTSKLAKVLEKMVANSKLISRIMLLIMAALVIANILYPVGYDRFFWESIPGAGAVFGVIAAVVIVVVSKTLGYKLLYRAEDYYDEESKGNELIGDPAKREANHD
jgi:membrane associated rhomboid family serine protease